MLSLPFPPTDARVLADWLEIMCISKRSHRCSIRELGSQLKKSSVLADGNIQLEEIESNIINELRTRSKAALFAYPFAINGAQIRLKSRFDKFLPYTFCLCLSYFGGDRKPKSELYPRRAFEHISSLAAGNYLQGESVRFGAPRVGMPVKFSDAINKLCLLVGEGGGLRPRGIRMGQDDTLDLVAWKGFPDLLPGKLLMFGQCASGKDWEDKASELQPYDFCDIWLVDRPISLLRAFFIPHRIRGAEWVARSIRAGIIFDRCRIAYWAQRRGSVPNKAECIRWCKWQLAKGIT